MAIRVLISLIIGLIILLSPDPNVSSCFSCAKVRNSYITPHVRSLLFAPSGEISSGLMNFLK